MEAESVVFLRILIRREIYTKSGGAAATTKRNKTAVEFLAEEEGHRRLAPPKFHPELADDVGTGYP